MRCLILASFAIGMVTLISSSAHGDEPIQRSVIFQSGADGYAVYRIPAILRAKDGTILAFAEGRRNGKGDSGEINLVLKRSTDDGKSFGPQQVVWADGPNTCGNPCPVLDEQTGVIWLLATHNPGEAHEPEMTASKTKGTRTAWIMHSEDSGKTWSTPLDITSDVKKPEWTWYATGPGIGIQLKHGPHAGRLIIPCDYVTPSTNPLHGNSHIIYSDDHGKSWHIGGEPPDQWFNESQVVELSDGRVMLNMRMLKGAANHNLPMGRGVAISDDGGETFAADHIDSTLIDPRCQGCILRYSWPEEGKSRIVCANVSNTAERKVMKVQLSEDEGATWCASRIINDSWAAYSSLVRLGDGRIGLMYETGDKKLYERIDLARFSMAWLSQGHEVAPTSQKSAIQWQPLPDIPDPLGLAGAIVGQTDGALLFGGGANFPDAPPWRGGKKTFSSRVHVLGSDGKWIVDAGKLPRPIGYSVCISTDRGVIVAGGCDIAHCYADVQRLTWTQSEGLKATALPSLPKSLAFASGALVENTIYIVGGQESIDNAQATRNVYSLDLSKEGAPDFRWKRIEPLPGLPRVLALSAAQTFEGKPSLFVFSGRDIQAGKSSTLLSDAFRFNVESQKWESLAPIEINGERRCVMAGNAVATEDGAILLLGGDSGETFLQAEKIQDKAALASLYESHPGFSSWIIRFDPAHQTYAVVGQMPDPSPVTTPCVATKDGVILASGEARAGVRTPKVWRGTFAAAPSQTRGTP